MGHSSRAEVGHFSRVLKGPRVADLAASAIWLGAAFALGWIWLGIAALGVHIVGYLGAFSPEASRISSLLRWKLGIDGSTIPR